MSYTSGINQRFRSQTLYDNYTAEDVDITNSNLSLIANLKYVQNWVSSVVANYMTILNPYFSGSLISSTGGNIAVSSLTVPTITSNTNFFISPTVQGEDININCIGEIIIGVSNTPPPNTLLCDGSSVSISQYQGLYSLIGTTYGGSGGFFNLPNFSSYFPIGGNSTIGNVASSDISGGSQAVSANFGGASSSIPPLLTKMPLHSHIVNDFGHFHFRNTKSDDLFGISPGEGIISPFPFGINSSPNPEYTTGTSTTGITVSNLGDNILTYDTVSGLNGVNISLPYTSVFYYIFFA